MLSTLASAVVATGAPSFLPASQLVAGVVALLVLVTVAAIATRRYWMPRHGPVFEPPRTESQRERDEHLKLALWASGEHFWDYDLVQRRRIGDEAWAQLRRELSEDQAVEFCMVVGHHVMVVGMINSLDIRIEPGYLTDKGQ